MSYVSEVLADSPVAWYRLGEASGLPQDSSGQGNHATVSAGSAPTYGSASLLVSNPGDTAILFNNSGYFTVPDANPLDVGDVFTLECWIKRTVTNVDEAILDKGANSFKWYISAGGILTLEKSGVADAIRSTGGNPLTDTSVHHLVMTKNGSTRACYIDSVDSTSLPTNQTLASNTSILALGAQADAGIPSRSTLDEIAIYPTALTSTRVTAHYQAGIASVAIPGPVTWMGAIS